VRGLFANGAHPDAQPVSARIRRLTIASLVCWTVAVVAGRLTAYSGIVVLASTGAFLLVVTGVATVVAAARLVRRRRAPLHGNPFPLDVPSAANGGK